MIKEEDWVILIFIKRIENKRMVLNQEWIMSILNSYIRDIIEATTNVYVIKYTI